MSYRGAGGFGSVNRRRRAGDLIADDYFSQDYSQPYDFSDVTGGSSSVSLDDTFTTMGLDSGTSIVPSGGSSIWDDISTFVGGAGTLGPAIGQGILGGVKSLLGGGGGSPAAAGRATTSSGGGSAATKAAVKRALRVAGVRGGGHRMNPGNFKALRRSLRRLAAFERAARRVYAFRHPRPGRSHFKFPKRRKR